MFVEQLLGNSSKIKILRTLVEKNSAMSLYDLVKGTGLSIGIIHRELCGFKRVGIVFEALKEKKQVFYRINQDSRHYRLLKTIFSEEKEVDRADRVYLTVWNTIEILVRKLVKKFKGIREIFLFGSMATGSARYGSDIDIFVVVNREEQKAILTEARKINRKINNKINISFSTEGEFKRSSFPLVGEVKKGGIRLW